MLTKIDFRISSRRVCKRTARSSLGGASVTVLQKTCLKYWSENWYIGSMTRKSATTKYRIEPRVATGRYASHVCTISLVVTSAPLTDSSVFFEIFLDESSVLISASSSRMLPLDSASSRRIVSSSSWMVFRPAAIEITSSSFFCCRSGRSSDATSASSWSSRPSMVTVKFTMVTLMHTSGA